MLSFLFVAAVRSVVRVGWREYSVTSNASSHLHQTDVSIEHIISAFYLLSHKPLLITLYV